MSQKDTTEPIGRLEVSESPNENLSRLAELARAAYERKDTKDCLDLTRAMLLIDPHNADAHEMRASIQADMHRDLDSAREFLQQVQSKENPEKQTEPIYAWVPADLPVVSRGMVTDHVDLEPSLLAETVPSPPPPGNWVRLPQWLVSAGIIFVLGVAAVSLPRFRTRLTPVDASPVTPTASDNPKETANANEGQPDTLPLNQSKAVELLSAAAAGAITPRVSAPASPPRPDSILNAQPVMAASGTLAISSPTTVDIYKDDVYLGSVPVSLQLSAGTHTLEYRHGDLRQIVAHVINSNETTKATITFDVNVQINSKPWAEVFLEGVERKDLGQTPLSGARVPIGSVLSFENPTFPTKKYRVTGNETAIQMVFP